jgi:hypothetical protein
MADLLQKEKGATGMAVEGGNRRGGPKPRATACLSTHQLHLQT